ncbi:unnamed protein product [Orchesella dallaii]|uniref:Uncharacterized protein n=1 Tax=Orchesella dallaii TaxID=48710 RepID=A0ABP1Q4Y7_9HEXA
MLLEAIFGIIAISIVFCCCTFCCYVLFQYLLSEEKTDVQPEMEVWDAKHYYDPLPLSTPSPPDTICKPTPYSFKLQNGNGNGVYAASLPHAVINPAVLQYPPGHVLDQQRVPSPAQQNSVPQKDKSRRHSHQNRSRTPSPSPRRAKNVWSTDVDFHRPHNTYSTHHSPHPHHHLQQYKEFQSQQKELQQHYRQHHHPVVHHEEQRQHQQHRHQQHPQVYQDEVQQYNQQQQKHHHHQHQQPPDYYYDQSQSLQQQHSSPFMASTHATNVYPHQQRYKSRLKEAIT